MGKPVRWFKKFFKSSKSPLKRKSNEKENEQDQVIASKSPNEKQINANVPTRDQVTQEFTQAVEADPHQDQNVMQLIAEPRKIHVAATMESVTSHPLPPPPDMCSTVVKSSSHGNEDVETKAAIRIQTAFRGFLASRAFSALKGLVRLQALVRGHRVRRQAAVALRCVLAIVKLQAHARAYLLRMTEGGPEAQKVIHGSPQTANEVEQPKRICQTNTNITLASAFQRQLNSSLSRHFLSSFQVGKHNSGWCWLERWTTARPWVLESVSEQNIVFSQEFKRCKENGDVSDAISKDDRAYCGKSRISLTEKMPLPNPPISSLMTPNGPSHYPSDSYLPPERSPSGSPLDGEGGLLTPCQGSPHLDFRSSDGSFCVYDPSPNETISRKSAPLEKERDSVSSKNTPRFSNSSKSCSAHESPILAKVENIQIQVEGSPTMVPSYMATTESSKAKVRSNSTPRNRPDLTEKSPKTFKRRLSLPGSNGKASPEATHSQRWNLYGRPGSIGFGSSVRVEKHASLLSGSRREIQKNLK